jgi:hypothetical protein
MKHIYLLISFSIATGAFGTTYTTNFPLLENPIYEQGAWISGGVAGINWTNVRTTPGIALGTMPGNASGDAQYADSTAVLAGTWGPDQTAQAHQGHLKRSRRKLWKWNCGFAPRLHCFPLQATRSTVLSPPTRTISISKSDRGSTAARSVASVGETLQGRRRPNRNRLPGRSV